MSTKNGKIQKRFINAKINLSKEEIHERAISLATVIIDKAELDDQRKEIVSDFKSKIDGKDAEINSLSRAIREGYEYRDVEFDVKRDVTNKVNRYVIKGTDTLIKEVPFNEEDMQLEVTDKDTKKK